MDDITVSINKALDIADVAGIWASKVPKIVVGQILNLFEDDLMGSKTIFFPAKKLARTLPKVGDTRTEKHRFGGNSGDLPFEVAGGPDYDLFIQISRVA